MDALIQTLFSKRQELLIAIWQHIQISLISLLFALIIALPLALAVVHHQRTAGFLRR
ncbi:binding-protein-dependent transport systems inner membrane protein [Lacticaseibacillus paracasei subsp. paracasei Lpp126]|uniref:Binding-protein-dependent transport systems inner membrane protein n=1 Tax=Lacticaseibacillus paracasei subsp. paracasei Lpp126 TaxID=1256206 RepID=S2SX41_LACPA|nr:binding-protein-dependent transport systems inner membrane protein [Lacticaseibacillus paracasei subsp. paracasei Lpp126]